MKRLGLFRTVAALVAHGSLAVLGAAAVFTSGPSPARAQASPLPEALRPHRAAGLALNVSDLERSRSFYTDVLGMKVVGSGPEGGPVRYYTLGMSGDRATDTLLVLSKGASAPATSFGRVILYVPDARALAQRVAVAGYPVARLSDRINLVNDPDGYLVELIPQPDPGAGRK